MLDKEIEEKTKSCVRSRKMTVTSEPSNGFVGVSEPFGLETQIPYNAALADLAVGDAVWVNWYFNNASTMIASARGNGQFTGGSVYPVGSIYLSVNSTSPATLFGGTWERIQDTFLLAAGTSYAAGSTGGEASHTLTVGEMPSHTHSQQGFYGTTIDNSPTAAYVRARNKISLDVVDTDSSLLSAGDGQAHNNMPPYLAVYVWKRTA